MCEDLQRQEKRKKSGSTQLAKHFTPIFDDEELDAFLFYDFIGQEETEPEINKYHRKLIEK